MASFVVLGLHLSSGFDFALVGLVWGVVFLFGFVLWLLVELVFVLIAVWCFAGFGGFSCLTLTDVVWLIVVSVLLLLVWFLDVRVMFGLVGMHLNFGLV